MKPKNLAQHKVKNGNIQNQKFLQGMNIKSGQGCKIALNHKIGNYKLLNNISREPDYIISSNLINQNQQKQYIQNNKNFDSNNHYIDKRKNNYLHPKDNNNANKAQQRPESGDMIRRREYAENPLGNRNNINYFVSKYSSYDKKPKDKPNTYQKIYANQEKATLNKNPQHIARPKQPEKKGEKNIINAAANNSPENKTKPIRKDNCYQIGIKKSIKKKQLVVDLNSSNKKNKSNLLDSTSKEDKKNPYFSQDNFHQTSLFRNKKEDNSDSNKRQTPNYNEAISKTNDIRTKNFNNYYENKIKDIIVSKGSQPNNKNEAEKF